MSEPIEANVVTWMGKDSKGQWWWAIVSEQFNGRTEASGYQCQLDCVEDMTRAFRTAMVDRINARQRGASEELAIADEQIAVASDRAQSWKNVAEAKQRTIEQQSERIQQLQKQLKAIADVATAASSPVAKPSCSCKTEGPNGPIWCTACGHDPKCCTCD